ncbi:hypothetical protein WICPIJ_002077 [Wickerhamomyces pijperi]|uniref:F-box domain-containing protein n=1 Tax=Wickerhamomyces pijperi TaxID=599730 RepID=A0A9P8TQH6_WICPI|nr:hypothetical protein WICPIJ_002077 [Wickerhamomyces pijperi]
MDSDSNSVESSVYSMPRTAELDNNTYKNQRTPAVRNSDNKYPNSKGKDFDMNCDGPAVDVRELAQHHLNNTKEYGGHAAINKLPPEVLLLIFSQIPHKPDLVPLLTVCRKWGDLVVELLWFRPSLTDKRAVAGIKEVMSLERSSTYWDYRRYIRRLNLSFVVQKVDDHFLHLFEGCTNLERLTLVNCSGLTHTPIVGILQGCSKLQSVDMTGVKDITDDIFNALAENSPRLQGLYAPQCPQITNGAFLNIVRNCNMLKRVKVSDCANINDQSILELVEKCKSLIEVDVHNCPEITDESLQVLFADLEQLREFRISQNTNISDNIFRNIPEFMLFERLRIVDFTSCVRITDRTVERIVVCAPRLRNVVLSKCLSITDASLRALSSLGKNLHYIHLGHCSNITDEGVITLIDRCRRLQYIDLACCSQLTNRSVAALKDLPRLRRIGLVKCTNINNQGIMEMIRGRGDNDSLERVHLSYCLNLELYPIFKLLMACPKLTHLSLTGIDCFLREEITRFCRDAPPDFNEHQKSLFCVFSGQGVKKLREYLMQEYQKGTIPPIQMDRVMNNANRLLPAPIPHFNPENRRLVHFRELLAQRIEMREQLPQPQIPPQPQLQPGLIPFVDQFPPQPLNGQGLLPVINRANFFRDLQPVVIDDEDEVMDESD